MLPRKEFLDILTLMEKFKLLKIPQEPHIFQGIVPGLLRASKKMGFSEGLWTFMLTGLMGRCMEKQSKANCAFSHILRDFRSVKSFRSLLQIRTVPRLWEMCPPPILATFGFWIWQGWPATMPAFRGSDEHFLHLEFPQNPGTLKNLLQNWQKLVITIQSVRARQPRDLMANPAR